MKTAQQLAKEKTALHDQLEQLILACRFLLKLKDAPVDGKWDVATIRRIDEIFKRVGA